MWDLDKIVGAKTQPRFKQIHVIMGHVVSGLYCT